MESTTDTSRRQGRPGFWQYPDASPGPDDNDAAAPRSVPAQPGGAGRAAREQRLGIVLGWISIGLGAASVVAPRFMARAAGMPPWPTVLRAVGMRELVSGVGLLNRPGDQLWRWSRVAGDAMDLALVGLAATHPYANRRRLASTALALATVGALDLRAANPPRLAPSRVALERPRGGRQDGRQMGRQMGRQDGRQSSQHIQHSVSINRPPDACYRFWRDLARLPSFMRHLESVSVIDERRSHWRARGPAGSRVEWDAEITDDHPGQLLGWRSVPGADVENAGTVHFIPANGGRATVLQVRMSYLPPAGRAGAIVARLFGEEPSIQMRDDLRRFKQLIETGEIPTTRGQPSGARSLLSTLFHKGADQ
ncbi:cyclase/dehydrase [Massilia sp. CCM 8733]|uniref:Cyclase/dehydrase n=1 Tax=Massilia mucilaginosa TaxID=2609282 RepID=A0ABX0NZX6_9BURK|nr:SRPBCC family protein [Massilia mucilaginosa]NHZ92281.1 cyclase/dehydrase [Massilia mucilaginosa]